MSATALPPLAAECLWTAKDVAAFLRVSVSWVYLHVQQGDLPYRRVGGLVRFAPEDVRAYAGGESPPLGSRRSREGS